MNEMARLFSVPVSTRLVRFSQRQPSKIMADNMQNLLNKTYLEIFVV